MVSDFGGKRSRMVVLERDLLKEQLKAFQRQLFAANSEVRGSEQKDLFLNAAEALVAGTAAPAQEEQGTPAIQQGLQLAELPDCVGRNKAALQARAGLRPLSMRFSA